MTTTKPFILLPAILLTLLTACLPTPPAPSPTSEPVATAQPSTAAPTAQPATFSAMPTPASRPLLGLNPINYMDGSNAADFDGAQQMGASIVRLWVYWGRIEAQPGQYDWTAPFRWARPRSATSWAQR